MNEELAREFFLQNEVKVFFSSEDSSGFLHGFASEFGFFEIDTRSFCNLGEGYFEERIIEETGYAENGATNLNVFYELICDLRWLKEKKIVIYMDNSSLREFYSKRFYVLNAIMEGAGRIKIEQGRDLRLVLC